MARDYNYHIPENEVPKLCERCNEPFYPSPWEYKSSWRKRRFCSQACANKALGIEKTRLKGIPCGFCHKIFQPRETKDKYCSRPCYWKDRKENPNKFFVPTHGSRVTVICVYCQTPFEVIAYFKDRKFCSRACYYAFLRKEHPPNLITRNALNAFYLTEDWRKARGAAAKRDNYTCQRCKRQFGRNINGMVIHHIQSRASFDASDELHPIADALNNLKTLCRSCHQKVHTGHD